LIKKGERVGSSEATLLQMLDVKPFEYGLHVVNVYDSGQAIDIAVLDITDEDVLARFAKGVTNVACLSLGAHFPSLAAFPHIVVNGFKNLASIAIATDYDFEQAKKLKEFIKNPGAFAAAAPAPATKVAPPAAAKAEPKPAAKEPSEEAPPTFDIFG